MEGRGGEWVERLVAVMWGRGHCRAVPRLQAEQIGSFCVPMLSNICAPNSSLLQLVSFPTWSIFNKRRKGKRIAAEKRYLIAAPCNLSHSCYHYCIYFQPNLVIFSGRLSVQLPPLLSSPSWGLQSSAYRPVSYCFFVCLCLCCTAFFALHHRGCGHCCEELSSCGLCALVILLRLLLCWELVWMNWPHSGANHEEAKWESSLLFSGAVQLMGSFQKAPCCSAVSAAWAFHAPSYCL